MLAGPRQAFVDLREVVDVEVTRRSIDGPVVGETPTGSEEDDSVALSQVVGAVGGEDDGRAVVGELAERPHQPVGGGGVESGRRLVEEQGARPGQQFDADARPLALSTTELAHPDVGPVSEAERLERFVDERIDLGTWSLGRQPELGGIAQRRPQR